MQTKTPNEILSVAKIQATSSIKSGVKSENKSHPLPYSIFSLLPQRVTWRGNRGTSSSHAGFYSSQAVLMAVSSIYWFGTASKRTRSGALASSAHTSRSPNQSRRVEKQGGMRNKLHSGEERIIFITP